MSTSALVLVALLNIFRARTMLPFFHVQYHMLSHSINTPEDYQYILRSGNISSWQLNAQQTHHFVTLHINSQVARSRVRERAQHVPTQTGYPQEWARPRSMGSGGVAEIAIQQPPSQARPEGRDSESVAANLGIRVGHCRQAPDRYFHYSPPCCPHSPTTCSPVLLRGGI